MLEERRALLAALFEGPLASNATVTSDAAVATVASDLSDDALRVFTEEEAYVAEAAPARRREFRAGRACAHAALAALGVPVVPVLRGAGREPLWPAGIVGCITHTAGFCAAALAHSSTYQGVGLDAELDEPVTAQFVNRVCSEKEREQLRRFGPLEHWANVVFSAKESIHKLQYPLSRQTLYWHDLEISLEAPRVDAPVATFWARFLSDAPPFRTGTRLQGRWSKAAGLVLSGCVFTRG